MKELIGTWKFQVRHFEDSGKVVGALEEGQLVMVKPTEGREFVPGIRYIFYGKDGGYKDRRTKEFVKQFQAKHYKIHEPASRVGVTKYLKRYAGGCGLGPRTIIELLDQFGSKVVEIIRLHPVEAANATSRWTVMQAEEVSKKLNMIVDLENTRLELVEVLGGRGFPLSAVDKAIALWQLAAIENIKRNPFILLVAGIPGCGFMRCDKLYLDLGHDPHALDRQMLAIWHTLITDTSGNTWLKVSVAVELYRQKISNTVPDPKEAIKTGIAKGWLSIRIDDQEVAWIAAGNRDREEGIVVARVVEMINASNEEEALLA